MNSEIASWTRTVETHHAQIKRAEAAQSAGAVSSTSVASYFAADPRRSGDVILDRVIEEIDAGATVLDVGGGAGRYALPIALKAKQVTVVEPSSQMVAEFEKGAQKSNITNVRCVQQPWLDAEVEQADVVLCASVLDGVVDIEPFIKKLTKHATKEVFLLQSVESPLASMAGLWQEVHAESRVDPPGMRELVKVLWELNILPNVEMLKPLQVPAIPGRQAAEHFLSRMLYIESGTEKYDIFAKACDEVLVETPNGFSLRGTKPRQTGLISWDVR